MLSQREMELLQQIAQGVAKQFGSNCEVVIHEISERSTYSSIVAIENGHVTGRKVGDGPSHIVLELLGRGDDNMPDHLCFLTRTPDGKILKSSSIYIRDSEGKISAVFSLNFDISTLRMCETALHDLVATDVQEKKEPDCITLSVSDLLDDLIRQADELVGKPAALMTKDDKMKAIRYLSKLGALTITKSGDKIAKHFGISRYTLYSYLDNAKAEGEQKNG